MDKPTHAALTIITETNAATDPVAGALNAEALRAETKPDALSMMAIDANALAHAIASGRGQDISRLINDLLKSRAAA